MKLKPVVELKDISDMDNYNFIAIIYLKHREIYLASNSINNLLKEIKFRRFKCAWITRYDGDYWNAGQCLTQEWCYEPRYR